MPDQPDELEKEEKPIDPEEPKAEDNIPALLAWDRLPRLNFGATIELSSVAHLSQRLSAEVFEQFKQNHSSQEIHGLILSQGEDAVVAMAEAEAGNEAVSTEESPLATGQWLEPFTPPLTAEVNRYQPPAPAVDEFEKQRILLSLRRKLGNELYEKEKGFLGEDVLLNMVATFGEDQAVELMRKAAGAESTQAQELSARKIPDEPVYSTRRPAKKVRTREMERTLNRRVVQAALIYAGLIGGFYPDFSAFSEVYNSLFPLAFLVFFVVALINIIRTKSFEFEVIVSQAVVISLVLGCIIALGVNVVSLGIKTLAAAGIAFAGVFLIGMLLGKPIFRWIERRQLEKRHDLYVGIGVALGLAVLIASWWGIDYLVKLLLQ